MAQGVGAGIPKPMAWLPARRHLPRLGLAASVTPTQRAGRSRPESEGGPLPLAVAQDGVDGLCWQTSAM